MATVTDDFNRTHGAPLGANWTLQQGSIIIHTNRAHGNGGGHASSFYSGAIFQPNQASQVTVDTGSPDFAGVGVRMSGTGGTTNNYTHLSSSFEINAVSYNVFKTVNGVRSGLAFHGLSFAQGDTIGISISGSTISYLKNGAVIGTVVDGQLTTGAPGIAFLNNDTASDNWIGSTPATLPLPVPPAPVPLTPCTPQTTVGNGGKGQAGCNTGGLGWEPSYTGALGTVPVHADPTPGESLLGKNAFDLWVEVDVLEYPSLTLTTYRRAVAEIADVAGYFGPRKPAGLLAVGDLENGLPLEAANADITWSDTIDRLFRTLLDDQDLEGSEVRVYAASPAARAASQAPRLLYRGTVQRQDTSSPLTATLTAIDPLFAEGGPLGSDKQYPPRIPDLATIVVNPASLELAQPSLYGEKSDEGARDPETNDVVSKGLCPLIYLGPMVIDDAEPPGVPEQDLSIPAPEIHAITNLFVGSGGEGFHDTTYTYLAAQRVSDGVIGTLAGPWELNPAGQEQEAGTYNYVHFSFLNDEPNPAYQYIAWTSTDPTFHPITNPNVGQRGTAVHDGVTRDSYYEHADRDASVLVKPDPVVVVNEWDMYLALMCPAFQVINLYGSSLGAGESGTSPDRVLIDTAARGGSDVIGPDWPNWPFPNRYVEVIGKDGTVYWWTLIGVRGPLSEDHRNGVVTLAVNMIGVEDVGDGTGLPLMRYEDCRQHWYEHHVLGSWTSGLYVTNSTAPKWADGTYKFRSSRFAAHQTFTAASLGDVGLKMSWYSDTPEPILDIAEQMDEAAETQTGKNGFGQITCGYIDETLDPSTWPHINHVTDLYGPIRTRYGVNRENAVRGAYDWDPDAERFRGGSLQFTSAVGYAKYHNRWKFRDRPLDTKMLNDAAHWTWVLERRLARLHLGEIEMELSGPAGFMDYDVDSPGLLLTTIEGRGAAGYDRHQVSLFRRSFGFASRLTGFTVTDIRDVLIATAYENGLDRLFVITDTENAQTPLITDTEALAPLILN